MAATSSSSKNSTKKLISELKRDYPQFSFRAGNQDHWSPKTNTITYKSGVPVGESSYGVLHELAHAQLGHRNYHSDFELIKLESLAWELAAEIGRKYKVEIDDEHIQNCLDTYRDWLHARSLCPSCGMHVLQKDPHHYRCFNCGAQWRVTSGHFVRPYRLSVKT